MKLFEERHGCRFSSTLGLCCITSRGLLGDVTETEDSVVEGDSSGGVLRGEAGPSWRAL